MKLEPVLKPLRWYKAIAGKDGVTRLTPVTGFSPSSSCLSWDLVSKKMSALQTAEYLTPNFRLLLLLR